MQKLARVNVMTGLLMGACLGAVNAQEEPRTRGLYVGIGGGSSAVTLGSGARNEEGIDFSFAGTDDNDMAGKYYFGYWITDWLGIEAGYLDIGQVDQDFDFDDPRSGRAGSGMAEVEASGGYYTLLGSCGYKGFSVFGKAGMLRSIMNNH